MSIPSCDLKKSHKQIRLKDNFEAIIGRREKSIVKRFTHIHGLPTLNVVRSLACFPFKSYAHLTQFLVGITSCSIYYNRVFLIHDLAFSFAGALFLIIISSLFFLVSLWFLSLVNFFFLFCFRVQRSHLLIDWQALQRVETQTLECWSINRQFFKSLAVISSMATKWIINERTSDLMLADCFVYRSNSGAPTVHKHHPFRLEST